MQLNVIYKGDSIGDTYGTMKEIFLSIVKIKKKRKNKMSKVEERVNQLLKSITRYKRKEKIKYKNETVPFNPQKHSKFL